MIKERLNNKYLRISTMKPHLCVKNIDKTSSLCFTSVILTLCGDVIDIRSCTIQNGDQT